MSTETNTPIDCGCTGNCSIATAGGIAVCTVCGWDDWMDMINKLLQNEK